MDELELRHKENTMLRYYHAKLREMVIIEGTDKRSVEAFVHYILEILFEDKPINSNDFKSFEKVLASHLKSCLALIEVEGEGGDGDLGHLVCRIAYNRLEKLVNDDLATKSIFADF